MLALITLGRNWPSARRLPKSQTAAAAGGHRAVDRRQLAAVHLGGEQPPYAGSQPGYFINPLVNVLLGMLFLGERFRRMQWVAVALAFTGVLVQLWQFGSLPIIGLGLAFSFAFYGLLRKKIAIDAQTGMLIETLWLLPVAAAYLFLFADSPTSHLSANPWSLNLLLVAAGIVTTVPLLCFTAAATRLRLSTLGFFQYLGPTLMFLLAITFYGETVGQDKLVTFGFIWAALILFTLDALYTQRKLR